MADTETTTEELPQDAGDRVIALLNARGVTQYEEQAAPVRHQLATSKDPGVIEALEEQLAGIKQAAMDHSE